MKEAGKCVEQIGMCMEGVRKCGGHYGAEVWAVEFVILGSGAK